MVDGGGGKEFTGNLEVFVLFLFLLVLGRYDGNFITFHANYFCKRTLSKVIKRRLKECVLMLGLVFKYL